MIRFEGVSIGFGSGPVLDGLDLEISGGEFVALLGPSGSGKSTILRLIAGLEMPDAGRVTIDGRPVDPRNPGGSRVAMVFEDAALYEHLDVGGNLALPLRMRGIGKGAIEESVERRARKVGIRRLLPRRPKTLSGGERGLVAVGRAYDLPDVKVLLLDEPLSKADRRLRTRFRSWLAGLEGVTIVLATNDQEEAMALADRIAVLVDGGVGQLDVPMEVYRNPASKAVASFIGHPPMNLFPASVTGGMLEVGTDRLPIAPGGVASGRRLILGVHPSDMHLARPDAEFDTLIHATTGRVEALGSHWLVWFGLGSTFSTSFAFVSHEPMADGRRVELTWERGKERFFDAASGRSLRI